MTADHCGFPWQQMIIDLSGKVEPCCYFSGYMNSGEWLGDANRQSLEDIWNGEGYRNLRRVVAGGSPPADHPCHPGNCPTRRAEGVYPSFHVGNIRITKKGHGYVIPLREDFAHQATASKAPWLLYEDEAALAHPDAAHNDVYAKGHGRYSLWGDWLYLSSSDGSDPCENGRAYSLRRGDEIEPVQLPYRRDCASGANIALALKEYQAGKAVMTAKPCAIQASTTSDCNIDCPHCSQNDMRQAGVTLAPRVIDEILALVPHLQEFMWFGGEPYLIPRFRSFIDEFEPADNPNLCFGFTSNGTMLTPAEVDKLLKFPRINAAVSVDSFVPETFERVRQGAKFERVLANLQNLLAHYDPNRRTITVGLVVFKSTMAELAFNVRTAIERDIPLNLSPCLLFPLHEGLFAFADVDHETAGWIETIDQAIAEVDRARQAGSRSIRRNDIGGQLLELRRLVEDARRRYADCVEVKLHLADPHGSLGRMRQSVLVVTAAQPMAAIRLVGPGDYTLRLPAAEIGTAERVSWDISDDGYLRYNHLAGYFPGPPLPTGMDLTLPDFTGRPLVRNIQMMKAAPQVPGGGAYSPPFPGIHPFQAALLRAAPHIRYHDQALPKLPTANKAVLVIGNLGPGGAERQIATLAGGLSRAGWDVAVITLTSKGDARHFADDLKIARVPVHPLDEQVFNPPLSAWPTLFLSLPLLHRLPPEIRRDVAKATLLLRTLRPNLVICYLDWTNILGGLAALSAGVKRVLLSGRNLDPTHFPYLDQPWFKPLYLELLASPAVTLNANSHAGARSYESWLGLAAGSVPVVHNGLAAQSLPLPGPDQAQTARLALGVAPDQLLVLGVFRLSPEKRPQVFFDLVVRLRQEFPGLRAVIAGVGNSFDHYAAMLRDRELEGVIRLLGRRDDMPVLYAAADLMLHVSTAEGVPNAVMEAQWLGCPIAGTLGGGTEEILTRAVAPYFHGTDQLDQVLESASLLLRDPILRRRVADQARQEAGGFFSVDTLVTSTLKTALAPPAFLRPSATHMPLPRTLADMALFGLRRLKPRRRLLGLARYLSRRLRRRYEGAVVDIGHSGGNCWHAEIPAYLESDEGGRSRLVLLENDTPLGPSHAVHDHIRQQGSGYYSHWGRYLYFSTSDNSDPRTNGRRYSVRESP